MIGEPRLATFLLHIPFLADAADGVPDWWRDASQGGGWLGAQGSHVVDQVRSTLGEFARVSASLANVAAHGWSAEDAYLVHFECVDGTAGVMQSVAGDRGPMLFATRIAGTGGAAWCEGDRVHVADAAGTRELPLPPELAVAPPDPPPGDLIVTPYDGLHSMGIDMGPYTRLFEVFHGRIAGRDAGRLDPAPATFADGVASMAVLDAVRRSAREGTTIEIAR
jgi:predicted dehydrogenase